jgi:hypothetical protein
MFKVLDCTKRLEFSSNFCREIMGRKIHVLDRVLMVCGEDLREIRRDIAVMTDAVKDLVGQVRDYYKNQRAVRAVKATRDEDNYLVEIGEKMAPAVKKKKKKK